MRRVERLFQLLLLMQDGNVLTSQYLSKKLGVSTRTVYRDINDLVNSGVSIDGESGVGFLLRDDHRLPSLNFTNDEIKALVLGAEMVRVWSDRELGDAGETAIRKIERALPRNQKQTIRINDGEVHGVRTSEEASETLKIVRASLEEGEKLNTTFELRGERH